MFPPRFSVYVELFGHRAVKKMQCSAFEGKK